MDVKDLSRLSRNYTDAGSLIKILFVRLNVRFISLAKIVDSYKDRTAFAGAFAPLWVCEGLQQQARPHGRSRGCRGSQEYLCPVPVWHDPTTIVNYLNEHGVMCPSVYKRSKGLKYETPNGMEKPMWGTIIIAPILKKRVYG